MRSLKTNTARKRSRGRRYTRFALLFPESDEDEDDDHDDDEVPVTASRS